jgi:Leucine-rich repeat (LRR) protein
MNDFKATRIKNKKGLRILKLQSNLLSDFFSQSLESCLRFDQYIKYLDLSHNKMSSSALSNMIDYSLKENQSLLTIDVRFNMGSTS